MTYSLSEIREDVRNLQVDALLRAGGVMLGDIDMNESYGITDALFVDIGRAHVYGGAAVSITGTAPIDLLSLTGGTGALASGQVWHFTWGGYVESSVNSAGTWVFELVSGAITRYGNPSRLTSTWHTGDNAGQGGTFGGSCIVSTNHTVAKIRCVTRTVTGGTQLAGGLYIVGMRLS